MSLSYQSLVFPLLNRSDYFWRKTFSSRL